MREGLGDLLASTLESVERWEWQPMDSSLEDPEPFGEQSIGKTPIRQRKNWTPKDPAAAVRYGWDGSGRLRVARRYMAWGEGVVIDRDQLLTFAFHEHGDHVVIRHYRPASGGEETRTLEMVRRRHEEGGRLVELVTWPLDQSQGVAWVRKRYVFGVDGRAVQATFQREILERVAGRFDATRGAGWFTARYDDSGDVVEVHRQERTLDGARCGPAKLVWRRTDAEALRAAEQRIQEVLPEAVRAWVARARPEGPAYCLALLYGDSMGPSLGIGTVAELARWGAPRSDERLEMMWNPAEFDCFDAEPDELNTPELTEAYRVTAQNWGLDGDEKVRAACVRAALDLDPVTLFPDAATPLLVYAVDLELVDFDDNIRKLRRGRVRRAAEGLEVRAAS